MIKKPAITSWDIDDSLLSEVLQLSREVDYEGERTELGDMLAYLDRLRRTEEKNQARAEVLQRIGAAVQAVESTANALAYRRLQLEKTHKRREAPPRAEALLEYSSKHEDRQSVAVLKRLLAPSLEFYRDIERHFHDKKMTKAIESVLDGSCGELELARLVKKFMAVPGGASEEENRRAVELALLSAHLGRNMGDALPSTFIRLYDFMRRNTNHNEKLAVYIVLGQYAEADEKLEEGLLEGVNFAKLPAERFCLLLSVASQYEDWKNGVRRLLGRSEGEAAAAVADIIRYCRGEPTSILKRTERLGGEGTVLRLDFEGNRTLFFRFGDARSHALGYSLLRRYGLPTPESFELHDSMCNIETLVEGTEYKKAQNISRKAAQSLGRLLAACFVFGIPDPNETNFMLRGEEAVKIDAESAPYGWNYYSGEFIGGVSKDRPNDSYSFANLLRLHGAGKEIRAGFLSAIAELRAIFRNPKEIEALSSYVENNYWGAHIYRTAGTGLDENVLARLRTRLAVLSKYPPDELLRMAERGQEVR